MGHWEIIVLFHTLPCVYRRRRSHIPYVYWSRQSRVHIWSIEMIVHNAPPSISPSECWKLYEFTGCESLLRRHISEEGWWDVLSGMNVCGILSAECKHLHIIYGAPSKVASSYTVVLIFRTWAIWGRSNKLATFLLCFSGLLIVPTIIFAKKGLSSQNSQQAFSCSHAYHLANDVFNQSRDPT